MSKIDSRKTLLDNSRTNSPNIKKRTFTPNRLGALAALSLLTVVGAASKIDLDGGDVSRDTPPAVVTYDDPSSVTPSVPELVPGSPEALAEAQRIVDITNPNESARQASIDEANRLTGFQP